MQGSEEARHLDIGDKEFMRSFLQEDATHFELPMEVGSAMERKGQACCNGDGEQECDGQGITTGQLKNDHCG